MNPTSQPTSRSGFTLIELSIVLVIIGLIAGGVLVGQDMIKAAQVRNTTSQLASYNTAANTFRDKYGALPGDLTPARATQYNLQTRAGTAGRGDGNGVLEGGAAGLNSASGETILFWRDLSDVSLLPQSFSTAIDGAITSPTAASLLPATKMRESTYVHIFPWNGRNWFYVGSAESISNITAGGGGVITVGNGLSVNEANQVDVKTDDGVPSTGGTVAISALGTIDPGVAPASVTAATCRVTPTPPPPAASYYNADDRYLQNVNCMLGIRANF